MRAFFIFIILIIAIVFLVIMGKSRLPDMLANNLAKKLQVAVSIDSMQIQSSEIGVKKLEIANAKGYSLPKAFSAEEILVKTPYTEYFHNPIIVEEIEVNDIYLGLEFDSAKGSSGNWTKIMSNYKKGAHLEESENNTRQIQIKKLILNNIQADLLFNKNGGKIKRLPTINQIILTNITTEKGGFPTDQLMSSILGQMLKEVFIQENLGNMIQGVFDQPTKAFKNVTKPLKGFFNTVPPFEETF